ncbi:FtsX-like permease family protein [Candidatus Saccharibacteria bacterium]|nr:FtsX-like permease family protein [Candidatus Saccharibacteria bacterium]
MIGIKDTFALAKTKLKTRKIRTGLTVGISGILFAILISMSLILAGLAASIEEFSKIGFGSRYIVQANQFDTNQTDIYSQYENPEIIARAKVIHKELIAQKKLGAKQLQIEYDEKAEMPPTEKQDGREILSVGSLAAQQAYKEYAEKHVQKRDTVAEVKAAIDPFNPQAYYSSKTLGVSSGSWRTMKDGKETFSTKPNQSTFDMSSPDYDPLSGGVTVMDQEIVEPFLIDGYTWKKESGAVPVIISYTQAEKALGYKALGTNAKTEKASSLVVESCYRNDSSNGLLQDATLQKQDISNNKGKEGYVLPKRIVDLPDATACSEPIVKSDTRTAQEKKNDANMLVFEQKYENKKPVKQAKVTFQVVGLTVGYDANSASSFGTLGGIVGSVFSSNLGGSWVIPKGMYDTLPGDKKIESLFVDENQDQALFAGNSTVFAEFSSFKDALALTKKYSCMFGCNGGLIVMPFGGGSITFAQLKEIISQYIFYAMLVSIFIAVVIMTGTVSRAIADSRRETAVFRAIGAKRIDITSVYFLYSILIGLRVIVFAALLAVLIAGIAEYFISPDATLTARLLMSAPESTSVFHVVGVNVGELLAIAGIIIATAIVSALLPLALAIRRNPIKDMRDDT